MERSYSDGEATEDVERDETTSNRVGLRRSIGLSGEDLFDLGVEKWSPFLSGNLDGIHLPKDYPPEIFLDLN